MAKNKGHNAYTKSYIFHQDRFYIHQHAHCIGRANNGSALSDTGLAGILSEQKVDASNAAEKQYLDLFFQNVRIEDEDMMLLNSAFKYDPQKIAAEIDKQIKQSLQQGLNQKMSKRFLANQMKAVDVSSKIFSSDAKEALVAFSTLFECIGDTVKLIEGKEGAYLAQLLNACQKNGNIVQMGEELSRILQLFIAKYPMQKIQGKRIEDAYKALKSLSLRLTTMKLANKKDPLTAENIRRVVEKVFNPGLAEAVHSQIDAAGQLAFMRSSIEMAGKLPKHKIQFTDEHGRVVNMDGIRNQSTMGKVDFKIPHAKFVFKSRNKGLDGIEMDIDIGISNKFYRTASFTWGSEGITSNTGFSGGSGGSLKEAIYSLFGGEYLRYLAYNTIAHEADLKKATAALTDLLLTRQINRIFATRGGTNDFAQYMLINGEVVSMFDILWYVQNHFSGKSNSLAGSDMQAVALSIKKRPEILEAVKNTNAKERVYSVNKAISSARVTAYVHIDKLAQAVAKKNNLTTF